MYIIISQADATKFYILMTISLRDFRHRYLLVNVPSLVILCLIVLMFLWNDELFEHHVVLGVGSTAQDVLR